MFASFSTGASTVVPLSQSGTTSSSGDVCAGAGGTSAVVSPIIFGSSA